MNEATDNCDTQEDVIYLTLFSVSQNASQFNVNFNSNESSLVPGTTTGMLVDQYVPSGKDSKTVQLLCLTVIMSFKLSN